MKKIFRLLFLLPALLMAGCSSDNDTEETLPTYTMTGSMDAFTRVSYTDDNNTMKCCWEVGDVVRLWSSTNKQSYDFTVSAVDANGVATMSYTGTIADADNFTGSATYAPSDAEKEGIQTANDNTAHLKYGEEMRAELTSQPINGSRISFKHEKTAVYKVTFKAPVAFAAGSKLVMSGAWNIPASLTLNFSATENETIDTYIIYKGGSLNAGDKLKFSLIAKGDGVYSYTYNSKNGLTYEEGHYWLANISNKAMAKESNDVEDEDYVNLGLPSGTLWATKNIGASSPEEYGFYLAWSATDVATDCWGSAWRMPTQADFEELRTECTWTSATKNGVSGINVSKNGKSIFLPIAGYTNGTMLTYAGSQGYYWSSSAKENSSTDAYCLQFVDSKPSGLNYLSRTWGMAVRPVKKARTSTE